ncbi:hypothetical protein V8J88_07665 [Massilia sp. W12]|uniref:hypothetical protein n=1 Tax=Massilia sp. W12 TaxID=3126507 RepID=UPI0030D033A9
MQIKWGALIAGAIAGDYAQEVCAIRQLTTCQAVKQATLKRKTAISLQTSGNVLKGGVGAGIERYKQLRHTASIADYAADLDLVGDAIAIGAPTVIH